MDLSLAPLTPSQVTEFSKRYEDVKRDFFEEAHNTIQNYFKNVGIIYCRRKP